jgi:hypothetical protein
MLSMRSYMIIGPKTVSKYHVKMFRKIIKHFQNIYENYTKYQTKIFGKNIK